MSYKINLTDRGPSVISSIHLFDECHYGADKLFFRGEFFTPKDILTQIKIALGDESSLDKDKLKEMYPNKEEDEIISILGIGNPLEKTPEGDDLSSVPTIALNRFYIKDKKFWEDRVPTDIANPYKASAAVSFGIRVIFKEDSAFIKFGAPWSSYIMDESVDTELVSDNVSIEDFALFSYRNISKMDALTILEKILEGIDVSGNTSSMKEIQYTFENKTEEGQEYIVDEEDSILTH